MRLRFAFMLYGVACAMTLQCGGRVPPLTGGVVQAAQAAAAAAPVVIQSSVQVAHDPYGMVTDPATGHIFVTADWNDLVSVLDARTGQLLTTIKVGYQPTLMALDTRTEHLVVLNGNLQLRDGEKTKYGSISIIDVTNNSVMRTLPLRWNPYAVAVDAGAGRAFVVGNTRAMLVLDTATGAVLRTVQLPAALELLSTAGTVRFDPLTHHVFIQGSTVTLDRLIGGMVVAVESPGGGVLRAQALATNPTDMTLDRADGRLYVSGTDTPSGTLPNPRSLAGTVSILDTATGHLLGIERHIGHSADAITYDAVTDHLFVEDQGAGTVTIVGGSSGLPLRTISSLIGASALAVYGARHHLFVAIERTEKAGIAQVDVFDTRTGALVQALPLDPYTYVFPQVAAVNGATGHVFIAYRSDVVLTLADGVAPQLPPAHAANAADAVNLRLADLPSGTTVLGHHTGAGSHIGDVFAVPGQAGAFRQGSGATSASLAWFTVTQGLTGTSVLSLVISFRTAALAHGAFITYRAAPPGGNTYGVAPWPVAAPGQDHAALIVKSKGSHGALVSDWVVFFRQGVYVAVIAVLNASIAYPGEQAAHLAAVLDARIRHAS